MKRFAQSTLPALMLLIASQSYGAPATNAAAGPAAPTTAPVTASNVNVSPAERAKIEEVVHQYLVNKPEVIVEAIQSYQRKQYEQAEQTVKKTQSIAASFAKPLFHDANDPVAGNPKGKITVVEFFDYQCPHCTDMAAVIDEVIKNDQEVRVVFKEFPIRGPLSEFAARAALAANKQGKYYEFSHALLELSKSLIAANQQLSQDKILEIATKTGLNVDQLKKDMNDKEISEQVKANIKLAQDLKLFGTPAFFVGKTDNGNINYVPGQMDKKQMQDAIEKAKQ